MNIRAGDRRHPEALPYRCCLSTLAGFGRLCRAGPARTLARIPDVRGCVNRRIYRLSDEEKNSFIICSSKQKTAAKAEINKQPHRILFAMFVIISMGIYMVIDP